MYKGQVNKNRLAVRLHVLPDVNAQLVCVNGKVVENGSNVYIYHNDVVSFGPVVSLIFHYRPLLVCISPLDFDSVYRKDLTYMFTRLGATVINNDNNNNKDNYDNSHFVDSNTFKGCNNCFDRNEGTQNDNKTM